MRRAAPARAWAASLALASALVAAGCGVHAPVLSGADQAELAQASRYLDSLRHFSARFTQTGAFGPGAGLVWVDRPGNLRLDYQEPGGRVMVISGGRVRLLERSSGALTTQPLSRTPLGMLLAPEIHLDGDVTVAGLSHRGDTLTLTLRRTASAGQGSLDVALGEHPWRLLGVAVTDPYGRTLDLSLSDIDTTPVLTPGLFAPPVAAPAS